MKHIFIASLLLILIAGPAFGAGKSDSESKKDYIQLIRENPNVIPLDPNDPGRDVRALRRDPNKNPERKPGPINIQKTLGGTWNQGIPTFFRLPVALGPEDLKAGKVEVAFFGAAVDISTGQRGTGYGPLHIRMGDIVGGWGELPVLASGHPVAGDVDWTQELVAVDYGYSHIDILSQERSVLPV